MKYLRFRLRTEIESFRASPHKLGDTVSIYAVMPVTFGTTKAERDIHVTVAPNATRADAVIYHLTAALKSMKIAEQELNA